MLQQYLLLPLLASCSAAVTISVAKSGGNATTNLQYGAMEEVSYLMDNCMIYTNQDYLQEINHCGEGGLYAELIRNRAFQGSTKFPSSLDAWTAVGGSSLSLQNLSDPLSSALPTSVKVKGSGTAGLTNAGFWGIDVRPQKYSGSFYVKGAYSGSFTASLASSSGKTLASTKVKSQSVAGKWVQHEFTITAKTTASNTNNTFSVSFDGSVRSSYEIYLRHNTNRK